MANLRGGTFAKQAKNAFHRVEAFGTSKEKGGDNMTHSDALGTKREMILNDLTKFAEDNFEGGKLNELFNAETMDSFLDQRTSEMTTETAEGYTRAVSALFQGLEEKNVDMAVGKDYFDEYVEELKFEYEPPAPECRYIDNLENLHFDRVETELFKDVASETGLRKSEIWEVMNNPNDYLKNGNELHGVIGKGNHGYAPKIISNELAHRLEQSKPDISLATVVRDLKAEDITPHDFRFTYARDSYEEKIANGIPHEDAKVSVIKELNHHRGEMTDYYLKRT